MTSNENTRSNILVIGGGVSGLTTALNLLKANHEVTIIAGEAHSSANAYAMWVPVRSDDLRLERWAYESLAEFTALAALPQSGVIMRPLFVLQSHKNLPDPWYAPRTMGFRRSRPGEIAAQYEDAFVIEQVPAINAPVYLEWLRSEVSKLGGQFTLGKADLASINAGFDAVINCSSLGTRQLTGDKEIYPERMQVVTIRRPANMASELERIIIDDDGPNKRACIVPHRDYIKLGAVFDGQNEDLTVDDAATADILARCNKMAPGLNATAGDIIAVSRALRPERSRVRVEADSLIDGRPLIHNYGHDGMGFILSHGIAAEIVTLIKK